MNDTQETLTNVSKNTNEILKVSFLLQQRSISEKQNKKILWIFSCLQNCLFNGTDNELNFLHLNIKSSENAQAMFCSSIQRTLADDSI